MVNEGGKPLRQLGLVNWRMKAFSASTIWVSVAPVNRSTPIILAVNLWPWKKKSISGVCLAHLLFSMPCWIFLGAPIICVQMMLLSFNVFPFPCAVISLYEATGFWSPWAAAFDCISRNGFCFQAVACREA